jgi:4-hydroxy-tetrahydrodipicolinate synthase
MSLPRPLRGVIPPLVTPLAGRDELDYAGLARLVEHVLAAGCPGVFVLGSTGEAQALSYRLRLEMVRETARLVAGRVPVLAGITDTSVVESIRFGQASVEAGAGALVTAAPYYFRMSQADLLRHARMLADEAAAPLFLYNMPATTKLNYEPETVAAAAEHPNIAGFKDSSGDLIYFQRVLRLVADRPDFPVFIGPEELLGQAVLLGAHGAIAGGANLSPDLYVALYRAAAALDFSQVQCLERRIMDLSEHVYRVGDPVSSYYRGLKCALGLAGICSELPAPPLLPFADAERERIRAWLTRLTR